MSSHKDLEEFAELIEELHGTKFLVADLKLLQYLCWEQSQSREIGLSASGDPGYAEPTADVGKIAGVVFGAVLGAFFLPGLGIAAGWFAGAVIGGSIGYRLVGLFDGPGKSGGSTATTDPLFRFSGVGQLATLNTPISKIYGNRVVNPEGGVLLRDPPKIYTRAYSRLGSRYLKSLSILSYGQLGDVNLAGLKLDDKPIDDWEIGDITIGVSPGIFEQNAQSENYSQSVSIGTSAFIGSNPTATAGIRNITRGMPTLGNDVGLSVGNGKVAKDNGSAGWSTTVATEPLTMFGGYGGYIGLEVLIWSNSATNNLRAAIGLNSTPGVYFPAAMNYAVEIIKNPSSSQWILWKNGVTVQTGNFGISSSTTKIKVEIRLCRHSPQMRIELWIEGGLVAWTLDTVAYPASLRGVAAIYEVGTRLDHLLQAICSEGGGEISPGYGDIFSVRSEILSRLSADRLFAVNGVGFKVISKNPQFNIIQTNRVIEIPDYSTIQTFYRAVITTSKSVTSVEVILQANIFARNSNGDLVTHAQAFKLKIQFPDGVKYDIAKFIIISKTENQLIRSFTVSGLPKAIYQIILEPLSEYEISGNIQTLEDNTNISYFAIPNSGGLVISGEFGGEISEATARSYSSYNEKTSTSADRGAQIQVTHINEIVSTPNPPTYPNYAIASLELLASNRLQNAPAETYDIPKGSISPNYLVASFLSTNATNEFTFVNSLAPDRIAIGDVLRVLGVGSQVVTTIVNLNTVRCDSYSANISTVSGKSTITVSATDYANIFRWMPLSAPNFPPDSWVIRKLDSNRIEIGGLYGGIRQATTTSTILAVFNQPIIGNNGDEIVIYRMDSSCYFPDIYVDRLINSADGLGNYVDADHFIDYSSIVKARAFCVWNKFYFDGVISDGSFEQWATTTAPSSLLFCTEIEGRYGLVTQEDGDPNPFLFNDSNVVKYTEPGVPWQQELTNVMLVKYQDNLGREKQVKIATTAAANGSEPEVVQTIECHGVTAIAQAIKVGQTSLKSLKLQARACQIEADVSSGLYCRQGDIVRTQHTAIEYANERNGFVMSVQPPDNGRFETVNSVAIKAISNGYLVANTPHNIRKLDGSIVSNTEQIVVSGNSNAAYNRSYQAAELLWLDDRSIVLSPTPATTAGINGTLTVKRFVYDQIIALSETIAVTTNSRITLVHAKTRTSEQDLRIIDMGDGTYKIIGIQEAISFGDAWAIGELGSINRRWRITSIQPDVSSNKVTATGVLWDSDILSPTGLETIL